MSTKKPAGKRKTRKVQVSLPEILIRALDKEVRRARGTTRAALMKEILSIGIVRMTMSDVGDAASRNDARASLLKEAVPLVKDAAANEAFGNRAAASRLYLAAAAREIEAISYMSPDDEISIKSALIMAVLHMKKGTGYRHLPEVHVSSTASTPVQ